MKWYCEKCEYSFEVKTQEEVKIYQDLFPVKINYFGNLQCTACGKELVDVDSYCELKERC
jgi:hypothetical protein